MQCPLEIAAILGKILSAGLLRIRALGWNQEPDRCAIEADHLHNLPALLTNYRPELLNYYWGAERVGYIKASSCAEIAEFEPLWQALAEQISDRTNGAIGSPWTTPDVTAPVTDRT